MTQAKNRNRTALLIRPPYVIAPDVGVVAIDVTFGEPRGIRGCNIPLLCLGGHPAPECLLEVEGSGRTHEVALAIEPTSPAHRRTIERIRQVVDPSRAIQVVNLPVPEPAKDGLSSGS